MRVCVRIHVCSWASSLWSFALLLHWKGHKDEDLGATYDLCPPPKLAVLHGEALLSSPPSFSTFALFWMVSHGLLFFLG